MLHLLEGVDAQTRSYAAEATEGISAPDYRSIVPVLSDDLINLVVPRGSTADRSR